MCIMFQKLRQPNSVGKTHILRLIRQTMNDIGVRKNRVKKTAFSLLSEENIMKRSHLF